MLLRGLINIVISKLWGSGWISGDAIGLAEFLQLPDKARIWANLLPLPLHHLKSRLIIQVF